MVFMNVPLRASNAIYTLALSSQPPGCDCGGGCMLLPVFGSVAIGTER
jgi:hypothetical protein